MSIVLFILFSNEKWEIAKNYNLHFDSLLNIIVQMNKILFY